MAHNVISPATLPNLITAVKPDAVNTTPLDGEAANVLGEVDRQTRQFIYDFLVTVFANDSTLLAAAVAATTVAGKIAGTTANSAGTQQAIIQGTVSTPDLRNLAVDTSKLADASVSTVKVIDANITTAKIADVNVTTTKLADNAVTTVKITDANVTLAKLATLAVDTSKLVDGAVTGAKLGNNSVTPSTKLVQAGGGGHVLVSDGSNNWQDVAVTGDVSMSNIGLVTILNKGFVVLAEQFANATGAGNSGAGTYQIRGTGASPVYVTIADPQSQVISVDAAGKIKLTTGVWFVEAQAPGWQVGAHLLAILRYNSGNTLQTTLRGTSALGAATVDAMTTSWCYGSLTIASGDYIQLQHYTTLAATNGLGKPVSNGSNENYAILRAVRIG